MCVCVCMYVCMYLVCMDGSWMDEQLDGWTDERMYVHVCMYVCIGIEVLGV